MQTVLAWSMEKSNNEEKCINTNSEEAAQIEILQTELSSFKKTTSTFQEINPLPHVFKTVHP